jgi:cytoskeleton protein RodZ
MTSIGDTLRRERMRRNLELANIASELKISVRFLTAIEGEDFGKLPGGVFTKSFIRQYAAFLGLDGDELTAELQRTMEPPEDPQFSDKPRPDVPGIQLEFRDDWRSAGEHRGSWPPWITAGALLVLLMLVCSGVYWWWEKPRHQVLARETPPSRAVIPAPQSTPPVSMPSENPAPAVAPPVTEPAGSPPANTQPAAERPAAAPLAVPQSTTPQPAATAGIPASAPNPNASVRVGITADEVVWVRAEVNGKIQFEVTLQPHESRSIDANGEVKIRLGNAGGATLTLNGKPVGAVGPKGQIRTVQFTSGGFQIVSPPKVLDPLDRL